MSLDLKSSTLPLGHCTPLQDFVINFSNDLKQNKIFDVKGTLLASTFYSSFENSVAPA